MNISDLTPENHSRITSPFGDRIHPVTKAKSFHNGVDVAMPDGTEIISPDSGVCVLCNNHPTGGLQLAIKHDGELNGYRTGYAHLSQQLIKVGDRVTKGQVIAHSGNTGRSTGSHLHFTLTSPVGNKIDPITVFQL